MERGASSAATLLIDDSNINAMSEIFRAAHSVKGMAASLELDEIVQLSHALEDLASVVRSAKQADKNTIELLIEGGDELAELVEQVARGDEALSLDQALVSRVRKKHSALEPVDDGEAENADLSGQDAAEPSVPWPNEQQIVHATLDASSPQKNIFAFMFLTKVSALAGFLESSPTSAEFKSSSVNTTDIYLRFSEDIDLDEVIPKVQGAPGILSVHKRAPIERAAQVTPVEKEERLSDDAQSDPSGGETGGPLGRNPPGDRNVAVSVRFDANTPLIHARAYMVHRVLAGLPGFERSEPTASQIRQGVLPGHAVTFFFGQHADSEAILSRLKVEPSVIESKIVTRPLHAGDSTDAKGRTSKPEGAARTVRIKTETLDEFTNSVGELLLVKSKLRLLANESMQVELGELVNDIDGLIRELHNRVVVARMSPLDQVTDWLPPMVRKLSKQLKKRVDFEVHEEQVELDRAILDELSAPLVHLLRNAIDHGAEPEEERKRLGKPGHMKLTFKAYRDGDMVCIELSDDGKGMDPEVILQRALEKQILTTDQAERMSESEILELVCRPGFTTASVVSETSGRGVGMDAVKATVEGLGGHLVIDSIKGEGTRFSMRLPLTMAIVKVLIIGCEDLGPANVYAVPIHRVDRALDLREYVFVENNDQTFLNVENELIPLVDVFDELGFAHREIKPNDVGLLVTEGDRKRAFRVGQILGQEEVMIKPLGPPLSTFRYLSGGAILGDGRTAYILEPVHLGKLG